MPLEREKRCSLVDIGSVWGKTLAEARFQGAEARPEDMKSLLGRCLGMERMTWRETRDAEAEVRVGHRSERACE